MFARRQLLLMVGAFVLGTLLAELLGAANAGVAISVGSFCFIATTLAVILLGSRRSDP